jgi:hypothetical protein
VRHPARQEQCRVGDVAGVQSAAAEKVARVVESHQNHDRAAQQVDRNDARADRDDQTWHRLVHGGAARDR